MRILDSSQQFKGVVFNVVSHSIETDEKSKIVRQVVEKKPCVVVLVRHKTKDTVILAEEFRAGSMSISRGFPAGFIDEGETPIQSAIREVKEETGYEPVEIVYVGQAYASEGFTNELIHYFYAEVDGEPKEQQLDGDESIKLIEIAFRSLSDAFKSGSISGNHAHTCFLKCILHKYPTFISNLHL